jgi:mono/diheme cytochrome c family protein
MPVTRDVLARGRERYNIYCTPCHDRLGEGRGMIVQRGFPPPPSYHIDRLRQAPVGHFYSVITNGYGTMYSYASRISPEDRWAITAYIRALQLSQQAKVSDLPEDDRRHLAAEQPAGRQPDTGTK